MIPFNLDTDMPVDEIMDRWPETLRVMIRHRIRCIGCPFGSFHTVADAAAAHDLDEAAFAAELLSVIGLDSSEKGQSAFEEETAEPVRNI
jgi:hybrid cluster-associated redox disulfide protein